MTEINQAKLLGYKKLVIAGRRTIEEVPDPYRAELETEFASQSVSYAT